MTNHDSTAATSTPQQNTMANEPAGKPAWKTWPDWVNLVLAAYLLLSPLWTEGAPAGWFTTLGIIGAIVALWALATASSPASEWVQIVVGAVVFLSPWLGGFASVTAAAWTGWIIGLALIVFAAIALATRPREPADAL